MKLTIAIPTFDRYDALEHTLKIIIPQLCEGVELLVLDNASPRRVESLVCDLAKHHDVEHRVNVIRHAYNIGGNANIIRCLEVAHGEWVWVLGDDDDPDLSAVDKILSEIDEVGDLIVITFSYYGCRQYVDKVERTLAGYEIERNFAAISFISTNVYNRAGMMQGARHGYDMCYACAAHVAMALSGFTERGLGAKLSKSEIVREKGSAEGASYNYMKVKMRFLTLIELPFFTDEQRNAVYRGVRNCTYPTPYSVLTDMASIAWGESTGAYNSKRARVIFREAFVRYRNWQSNGACLRVAYQMASFSLLFSPIIVLLTRLWKKAKGRSMWTIIDLNQRD